MVNYVLRVIYTDDSEKDIIVSDVRNIISIRANSILDRERKNKKSNIKALEILKIELLEVVEV